MIIGGTKKLYFSYNGNGELLSVTYNNKDYYYVKNVQGDIIALYDESGNIVEEYSYDPWGEANKYTY